MNLAVGLVVECDRLRAVGVRRRRVLWGVDSALAEGISLADALTEFLHALPVGRFIRPRITVALAPTFAQTKRLAGLPPLGDERVMARTVSEHAARFFLRNGVPLVTTSVRIDGEGRPWAAALEKPVVDTIVAACRASRFQLLGIVPAADVSHITADVLASLGAEAPSFAPAYGAAVTLGALTWRAKSDAEDQTPRWRLVALGSAATVAVILAALAPGLAEMLAEHRALVHAARVAGVARSARQIAGDLDRVTAALGEVGAFDRHRHTATQLAALLARDALPEGAVLSALHFDSAGGSIVALAPRAAALLTRFERVPAIAAPEIVGPVTRETLGGRELERATIRFRWAGFP